jgi:hypothetical protein
VAWQWTVAIGAVLLPPPPPPPPPPPLLLLLLNGVGALQHIESE